MRNILVIGLVCLACSGCSMLSRAQVPAPRVALVMEDKIYTIPAGTEIKSFNLDGKEMGPATFSYDMKLVAPNILIKQEEKLNTALFAKIKSDEKNSTRTKIFGAILSLLGVMGTAWAGAWVKSKFSK